MKITMEHKPEVEISEAFFEEHLNFIRQKLQVFNLEAFDLDKPTTQVFIAKNDNGEIVGGVIGSINYQWLYISDLWVSESFRNRKIGTNLISAMENCALSKGCNVVTVQSVNAKANTFYQKNGYKIFHRLNVKETLNLQFFQKNLKEKNTHKLLT